MIYDAMKLMVSLTSALNTQIFLANSHIFQIILHKIVHGSSMPRSQDSGDSYKLIIKVSKSVFGKNL